jgi:ribosomal protein S12 methylthiotransferase accessory factor
LLGAVSGIGTEAFPSLMPLGENLRSAIGVLNQALRILPAAGGAVEYLQRPDAEEVNDERISLALTRCLECNLPKVLDLPMARTFQLSELGRKWPSDACILRDEGGFIMQWRGGSYRISGSSSEQLLVGIDNEVDRSLPLWLSLIDELEDRSSKRSLTDQANILLETTNLTPTMFDQQVVVASALDPFVTESVTNLLGSHIACGYSWFPPLFHFLSENPSDHSAICLVSSLVAGEIADWLSATPLARKAAWAIHWPEALYLIAPGEGSNDLLTTCIANAEGNSDDLRHALQFMRINSTDAFVPNRVEPPTNDQLETMRALVGGSSSNSSKIWKILPSGCIKELWAVAPTSPPSREGQSSICPGPDALLDGRLGILKSDYLFGTLKTPAGNIFAWRTLFRQPRHKLGRNDGVDSPLDAFAADLDPRFARFKSMMEAVERYGGMHWPTGVWRKTPSQDLDGSILGIEAIPGYLPDQFSDPNFPYHPLSAKESKIWLQGRDLASSEDVWVLSDSVIWPPLDNKPCVQATSSGTAAHTNYESACLTALYELIERDALMMAWLLRAACPQIKTETLDSPAAQWLRGIEACGYHTHLLDITTDVGIPVAMSLAEAQTPDLPHLLVNGGAGWSMQRAVEKSLKELAMMVIYHCSLRSNGSPVRPVRDCARPSDHARLYYDPTSRNRWEFLLANAASTARPWTVPDPTGGSAQELDKIRSAVGLRGRVVVVDRTPPEVSAAGLCVVSVVATGLQPIHFGKNATRLRSRRLQDQVFPLAYLISGPVDDHGLNPHPHPYN